MFLPTLYSRTSLGQVQSWQIEIDGSRYRTHEGIIDGVITTSKWTIAKPKNIGRANATSASEQALKEARAKHQKKIDKGYSENIDKIDEASYFEPMLAHTWSPDVELSYPVYVQPKLDGVRCVVTKDGMFSRNGKPIVSAPHIFEAVRPYVEKGLILDGELYNPDLDFNAIVSLSKKTKPTEEDLTESADKLEYWIYDAYDPNNAEMLFIDRYESFVLPLLNVWKVYTNRINNSQEMELEYNAFLESGAEGMMIRLDTPYEHKRSHNLLKRKPMQDAEFELVDLEEGRGNRVGMATRAILKTDSGILFEAGMNGSHKYCQDLLKNKKSIVGKMVTVIYQNLTPDGKPRFGKMKAIRDE